MPCWALVPARDGAWLGAGRRPARRRAYHSGLGHPLTGAEHHALPWAIARQPLWGIGGWVAQLNDQNTAQAHARATFPAIKRALQLATDIRRWQAGLT